MKLSEFMRGYDSMEIRCFYTGEVVRRLVRIDDTIDLDAITESIGISADTLLTKEAWFLDRGSICFTYNGRVAKLCTEGDILVFPDGTEASADVAGGFASVFASRWVDSKNRCDSCGVASACKYCPACEHDRSRGLL